MGGHSPSPPPPPPCPFTPGPILKLTVGYETTLGLPDYPPSRDVPLEKGEKKGGG